MYDRNKLEKSMKKLQSGDKHAFNDIYEQTHRLVFLVIYAILKDYQSAEYVMQNVFIKVYEKCHLYQEDNSVKAWISTIARNLALNEYNKNKKEVFVEPGVLDVVVEQRNEDTPLIDLAKDILDEDEFLIVMLCVTEGYKRREVAELMNLSTSGVTWKINHDLDKLKKQIERRESHEKE